MFDAVGWVTGRTSSLKKKPVPFTPKASVLDELEEEDHGEAS